MAKKKLYKSSIPSMSFIFKNGKPAYFMAGRYSTDVQKEIEELDEELKIGHPHIYVDKNETEVDTEALSPLEQIKKAAIEEYLAKQKEAAGNKNRNLGNSEQQKFAQSLSNSAGTSELGAESTSAATETPTEGNVQLSPVSNSALAKLQSLVKK